MDKNTKIWIVVPVFNRSKEIYNLLNDLYNQIYPVFNVVVVDHSTVPIDFSAFDNSNLSILRVKSDLWWTGAINRGLKYVLQNKNTDDLILVINDDVGLPEEYLKNMVAMSYKYPLALIGSININSKNGVVLSADDKLNRLKARFESETENQKPDQIQWEKIESDVLPARGMLIPHLIIDKIGLFNEFRLPHYGADTEFTWRAKQNGFQVICAKNCMVFTQAKDKSLYQFKNNFIAFISDKKKPGNFPAVINLAFLCFKFPYALYFACVNFGRFFLAYVKQFYFMKKNGFLNW